jgi:ribosome-binding factor A
MSHRKEQVESLLQRSIATQLQRGLGDPRMTGSLVSVTRVDVSPDFRNATVMISVLPEQNEKKVMHALTDGTMHLQHLVKKDVALRMVPHLYFKLDTQLKKQASTLAAINEAVRRTQGEQAEES